MGVERTEGAGRKSLEEEEKTVSSKTSQLRYFMLSVVCVRDKLSFRNRCGCHFKHDFLTKNVFNALQIAMN